MITGKLTSKAQTTVPRAVRTALGLREGDRVGYIIDGDRVVLVRAPREPREDPFAAFTEWGDEIDTKLYANF